MPVETGDTRFDPGSFRDPASRVRWRGSTPERVLSPGGREDWTSLEASGLIAALGNRPVSTTAAEFEDDLVLEHERIPLWSYPYEWSFSMLKAAARLQLEIISAALDHSQTVKDATPYNVQFLGVHPVFVDLGSFRPYRQGEPWLGYGQFCRLFLYPLLIQAHADIPFRPLLRGSLDGVDPETAAAMLKGSRLKSGVALDVMLQARAQRKSAGRDVRQELADAGFKPEMIKANLNRLTALVSKLEWEAGSSTWSEYAACDHVTTQRQPKADYVESVLAQKRRHLVWDLGANDGHFSRIASQHSDLVLAADGDELVIDRLFRQLVREGTTNITPLVYDLSDPSLALVGGGESGSRSPIAPRPDLVLLLAVVHHLVVGGNLPLTEVIAWLRSLESEIAFEWVPPEDPMAQALAINKRSGEVHADYNEVTMRQLLADYFSIASERPLEGRILFHLQPR